MAQVIQSVNNMINNDTEVMKLKAAPTNMTTPNADAWSSQMKGMDANRYATKKTIAQGMLDIALLTANASQLKYILQVGEQHQFYKLMLILISLSIVLQIAAGLLLMILSVLSIHKGKTERKIADVLNHVVNGLIFLSAFSDIIKMNFGLDPAVSENVEKNIDILKN